MLESLIAFKRAGARGVLTYFAPAMPPLCWTGAERSRALDAKAQSRSVRRWSIRRPPASPAALPLAGCSPNPIQIRRGSAALPRSVLTGIRCGWFVRQTLLPAADTGPGVRVDALFAVQGGRERRASSECRFAATAPRRTRRILISFRTEAGEVSQVQLFFLKRFWLETAEAQAADPQPVANFSRAPSLPPGVAHAFQVLLNALPAMATYGMLSAAYSLVYGLVGRINLAFGEMASIGAAASLTGIALTSRPGAAVAIGAALAAALWSTTMHGAVISPPGIPASGADNRRSRGSLPRVGLALAITEYVRIAQGSTPLWIPPLHTSPIAVARSGAYAVTVTPLALELTLVFGRPPWPCCCSWGAASSAATGGPCPTTPRGSRAGRVSIDRVFMQTFALASALAGAAGATVVLVYGSFGASFGTVLGLKGLLAAVLGGIGSVRGAFVGGILISATEALWSAFFPVEYRDLVLFSLLVCILVTWPGGLFGYPGSRAPRLV